MQQPDRGPQYNHARMNLEVKVEVKDYAEAEKMKHVEEEED